MAEIKIDKKYGFLIINKDYYSIDFKRGKPFFVKEDIDKVNKMVNMAGKIADKLKSKVDTRAIVTESVMKLPIKDIKQLYNLLFKAKVKYEPKTRRHHCVDIKIGNFILPIIDD